MYLTVSKRFEFSASTRLERSDLSATQNDAYFGAGRGGVYGSGNNFVVSLAFHGPVDPQTGMLINVSVIKERFGELVDRSYDHKFLNVDTKPFKGIPPTPENIARSLLNEALPLFADLSAKPVACHVEAPPNTAATAYVTGDIERDYWVQFSAARRTYSPQLSADQNLELFGIASAPMGHGHNYRLRVTVGDLFNPQNGLLVPEDKAWSALNSILKVLDHKNLNAEVKELDGLAVTTEVLAKFCSDRLSGHLPVRRVRLYEMDNLFAEYRRDGVSSLGLVQGFHAAHRLNSPVLAHEKNLELYGKCNNPSGHGHWYTVEATLSSKLDNRTGAVAKLDQVSSVLHDGLVPWADKHLDLETADFKEIPSTSENILGVLWKRLDPKMLPQLTRLRLWETSNNRFTLRRSSPVEN